MIPNHKNHRQVSQLLEMERIRQQESTGKIILTVIILIVAFCVVPAIVIGEIYNVSEILAQIF